MSRATPKGLNDEFNTIYKLKSASTLPLSEAKTSLESLFTKPEQKDEEEDELMEIIKEDEH